MNDILVKLREQLAENSDEEIKKGAKRFFKETITLYGIKTATVSAIAKESFKKIKELSKHEIFKLCEELWKSGYIEETFIASSWIYSCRKKYQPEDLAVFERWISLYVNNWASCDSFCNHSVGTLIAMYPELAGRLKIWAVSENLWMRRAAAVTLIVPAKEGKFLNLVFEISDILLEDKEDLVRKGYGWLLKVASNKFQEEVFEYVLSKRKTMPRTALRYAIEKMPELMKRMAMNKE